MVGLVLGEALVLSVLGGLIGMGIGVGLTEMAARVPTVGAFMEGVYTPGLFIQGLATAVCLGLIGGAYPTWWASNLQPVEALRYEGGGAGDRKGKAGAALCGSTPWVSRQS